jgi:Family of unknown function (DUF6445)
LRSSASHPGTSCPAPSNCARTRRHRFEADTFAFALFENDLDLNRILKLLDPQCIVTIGDMPSFTNPLAAPYYICRKWIHMDRAADLRGIDILSYAAAVYLTPDAPPQSGTSFWRDRVHGCRRRPDHPLERKRLGSDEAVAAARSVVYDHYDIEHGENWELMESVAGLYNRLVIWDAALFHSATTYDHFTADGSAPTRLVQLFFFDI